MKLGHKPLDCAGITHPQTTDTLRRVILAWSLLTCLVMAMWNLNAWAQENAYRARLSPMPTTPQTKNEILGEGEVSLSLEGNTLSVSGQFSGMSSAATAAHVHSGPPAQPGPVIFTLEINAASGGAVSSGQLSGSFELSSAQIELLRNHSLYIQIHSESNPGGELRGWVFARSHFAGSGA